MQRKSEVKRFAQAEKLAREGDAAHDEAVKRVQDENAQERERYERLCEEADARHEEALARYAEQAEQHEAGVAHRDEIAKLRAELESATKPKRGKIRSVIAGLIGDDGNVKPILPEIPPEPPAPVEPVKEAIPEPLLLPEPEPLSSNMPEPKAYKVRKVTEQEEIETVANGTVLALPGVYEVSDETGVLYVVAEADLNLKFQ